MGTILPGRRVYKSRGVSTTLRLGSLTVSTVVTEARSGLESQTVPPGTRSFRVSKAHLLVALFWISGSAGLVDQLCFSKYLGYVVGSTAYAVSAVLAAFMLGLALGAQLGGHLLGRTRRPLVVYGGLELLVAAFVAAAPLGFEHLTPLYAQLAQQMPDSLAALSALRWLCATTIVAVPTMAMGATLPILSRWVSLHDSATTGRQRLLGRLYAANTCGGALGALTAAYVILPELGLNATVYASAATSAVVGGIAMAFGEPKAALAPELEPFESQPGRPTEQYEQPRSIDRAYLLLFAAASGSLVFVCEVLFTHLLALIIGNSAYAFGLILATFLTCLFVGAALAPSIQARFKESALPLSMTAAGLALGLSLPAWDLLPLLFAHTGKLLSTFAAREGLRALVAFLILLAPTVLMGLTFPLLLQRTARLAGLGAWVGRLTAINTLGAVIGALAAGYVLLPVLGSERSLWLTSAVFCALGVVAAVAADKKRIAAFAVVGGAAVIATLLLPGWNVQRLTAGTNVYFDQQAPSDEILMLREDAHGGVTTVTRHDDVLTLYTNGKFQGNTGWEMHAQRLFAHYPSLFVSNFDDALVIGLGTGTTLGTLSTYPWKHLDVIEISPAVAEAARRFFTQPNKDVLNDSRVELRFNDGRNHLLVNDKRYDLIGMELSSIWFAGAANLYSKQFYDLVRTRLKPNGIFQQWVQLHHIQRRDFAAVLNTLRTAFDHVALFYGGQQGILVASAAPLSVSIERIELLQRRPDVSGSVPNQRPLLQLLGDILVLDKGLDRFVEESAHVAGEPVSALVSTDDNLYLEYATPRGNVLPWSERDVLVASLMRFRDPRAIRALLAL